MAATDLTPSRKRKVKSHKKSRLGCGNCKLRSVKCDEDKPECKKCISYGVRCNYNAKSSDLQFVIERTGCDNVKLAVSLPYRPDRTEEMLDKFRARTAPTCSIGKRLALFQTEMVELAYTHPALLHGMMTLTLMHDRHLDSPSQLKPTPTESYHWYQTISSFSKMMSHPRSLEEQAALWTTSTLLFSTVFCQVDANSPEDAWPLRAPSASDLDWLIMSDGKNEISRMTQSLIGHPIFGDLVSFQPDKVIPDFYPDQDTFNNLPSEFLRLYNLNPSANTNTNTQDKIFHNPLVQLSHALAPSLHPIAKIMRCWTFVGTMTPKFRALLRRKDPRGLLILLYWFARLNEVDVWWLKRRTTIEGQAMCLYLQRHWHWHWHHGEDGDIDVLLRYPRMRFFPALVVRGKGNGERETDRLADPPWLESIPTCLVG